MPESRRGYEFGPFRLDLLTHRLVRGGSPVSLTPKAVDTLQLLLENRDRVLGKDELIKALWPDSFVEEANLAQHVFTLRKALGTQLDGRPYIETIPKRGYRFAAHAVDITGPPQREASVSMAQPAAVPVDAGPPAGDRERVSALFTRRRLSYGVLLLLIIAVGGVLYSRSAQQRRLTSLIAVVETAANTSDFETVYARLHAAGIDPGDPRLASIASRLAGLLSIDTNVPASVRAQRVRLGQQPLIADALDFGSSPVVDRPLVAGDYVIDITAANAVPMRVLVSLQPGKSVRVERGLVPMLEGRADMAFVDEGEVRLSERVARVAAFFIDSHEVTNAEFQRFVAAGKYNDATLWPAALIVDGHEMPRAQALARFVDRTGLAGPRTWSNGRYPEGKANHPVVDVSWYEASAYARWIGKELPTFEQWRRAALGGRASGFPWGAEVKTAELRANFGLIDTSAVGAYAGGLSPFGCVDMAGNAREWLLNEGEGALHPAAGASWLEPAHDFERVDWFDAAQANPGVGFRLVASSEGGNDSHTAATLLTPPEGPPGRAADDSWIRSPVNDRTFESFSKFFTYDRSVPFDVKVVETKNDGDITVERLTFQSSPGMRVPALLLRPAGATGRPGVVLLHSAGARGKDLPNNVALAMLMARAGWSVIAIDLLYFGERATDLLTAFSDEEKHLRLYNQSGIYLAWMTQTVRDVRRALDLLIEQTHADASRVGLVGASRGAMAASVAAAVDRRFSPVALLFGGHSTPFELNHLEFACPSNYIGRVSPRPLLMLNSVNDQTMLRASAVQPLFALAGQPKDIIWTNGGHMVMTEPDTATVMSWLRQKMH